MKQWIVAVCLLFTFIVLPNIATAEEIDLISTEQQPQEEEVLSIEDAQSVTIAAGTTLYSDQQLTKAIGTWDDDRAVAFTEQNGVIALTILGMEVYVSADNVQPLQDEVATDAEAIGFVRVKNELQVYANSNNKSSMLTITLAKEQRVAVQAVKEQYFEVTIAGVTAYIEKDDTYVSVNKPIKVLQNAAIKEGTKTVATFTKNGVIPVTSVKGNTYTINKKYTFTAEDVVETDEKATWPSSYKQSYEVTLTAQNAAGLYNAQGKKFAEIPAKSKVKLVNMTDEFGVIRILDSTVFINMKDFKHNNLIAGEKILTHHEMTYKLKVFAMLYPEFMKLEEIGKSVEGRSIMALTVGTGKKEILMDAAMHAREHMTTNVLMEMVDQYSYHYIHNSKMGGYQVRTVLDRVKIAFVPMINPDGVTLVQGGKVSTPVATLKKLNGGSTNFKRWKANIRGIDLNRNWDVRWNRIPVLKPKWEMAKGSKPFSEPEVIALRNFVLEHPFKAYITYHSSGQIMFWEYGDGKGGKAKATTLVRDLSKVTGYTIMKNSQTSPTAASEPWVGKKKDAPAVTMEIAPYAGNGPVPLSRWASVWKKNQTVGLLVANKARGY